MIRKLALFMLLTVALLLVGCDSDDECANCPETGAIIFVTSHKVDLGAGQASGVFSIINKGGEALAWSISSSDAPWLSLSTTSGTNDAIITITADREQLTTIGVFRATLTISSNAINTESETVEVFIFNGGQWLVTDLGDRDSCHVVDANDIWWLKGFAFPQGVTSAFIDSISVNLCDTDTIQIIAFTADHDQDNDMWLPGNVIYLSEVAYVLPEGWSTVPVDIYSQAPLVFLGYIQLSVDGPRPGIGTSAEPDTIGSGRVFEDPEDPNSLFWSTFDDPLTTLLMRAFISPVIEYNPKLVPGSSQYYENLLARRLAERGAQPVSLLPRIR